MDGQQHGLTAAWAAATSLYIQNELFLLITVANGRLWLAAATAATAATMLAYA